MIRLAVSGALGKMGSRIIALAGKETDLKVVVCLESKDNPEIGKQVNDVKVTADTNSIKEADVLMEFTTPEATMEHVEYAIRFRKPMVIGTTGLSEEEKKQIKQLSKMIPIVLSPNMSVGVNVLFKIVKEAALKLSHYKVSIVEAHHVHKKDSPSGTAKRLAEIVEDASKTKVSDIRSIREGEIVGDHEVIFESPFDKIRLSHSAKTRDILAQGALQAARWIIQKKAGLYDMQDVLGK